MKSKEERGKRKEERMKSEERMEEVQNIRPHKKLLLWQKAMEFVVFIYALTESFPRNEEFGLKSQLRRAAVSVPSCIAEGLTRKSTADKLHFLNIVQGSLSEIDTQLEIGSRLKMIGDEKFRQAECQLVQIQRLLGGLIKKVKSEG